jgi:hypothetical protein
VLFFKCINIADVNIAKIFEIRGIQLSVNIILTVHTELGTSDTVLFSNIYKTFQT